MFIEIEVILPFSQYSERATSNIYEEYSRYN